MLFLFYSVSTILDQEISNWNCDRLVRERFVKFTTTWCKTRINKYCTPETHVTTSYVPQFASQLIPDPPSNNSLMCSHLSCSYHSYHSRDWFAEEKFIAFTLPIATYFPQFTSQLIPCSSGNDSPMLYHLSCSYSQRKSLFEIATD